jgi:general secretion pathway protein N
MTTAHSRNSLVPSANWHWVFWGALSGLVFALVLFAPARWLAVWVQGVSGGQVSLNDARGTVWKGSSQLVLSGGVGSQGGVALPGRLSWQLQPGLRGFSLRALAPCCMAQPLALLGQIRLGGFGLTVADQFSNWPAGLLAGLGTPWNTIAAEGNLSVSSKGLSLEWAEGRVSVTGMLQIDAQEMASRLTTLNPMGTYRLLLEGGAPVSLSLQTLEGSLQLSGAGKWVGGRLRFEGAASAAPERLDALSNLLNIIGRREGARSIIKVG